MANRPPIKKYKTEYCKDESGEYYKVQVPFKDGHIEVLLDIADFEEFAKYNWSVLSVRGVPKYMSRYCHVSEKGIKQRQQLHQMIMGVKPATPIDHIDGNGMNCRRTNMRVATRSENARNSIKKMKGSSVYKGVVWNKKNERWLAQIRYNGKGMYLGQFPKEIVNGVDVGEIKAARLYDKAAIKYFGTFASINLTHERNIVQTITGETFRQSFLMNERETKIIERKIGDLKTLKVKEIMEILEVMELQKVIDLCHYFGCGIEELITEIKTGTVVNKKYA